MIQRILLAGPFLGCAAGTQAQTVSGTLRSPEGVPLKMATIRLKGKPLAYQEMTNRSGAFFLRQVQHGDTLVFSFIGYRSAYYVAKETDTYIEGVLQPTVLQLALTGSASASSLLEFKEPSGSPEPLTLAKENVLSLRSSKPLSVEEGDYFTSVEVGPSLNFRLAKWKEVLQTGIRSRGRVKRGELEIRFVVEQDGSVKNVAIEKSYRRRLDRKIADYLFRHTRFNPAVQNGWVVPASCALRFTVRSAGGSVHLESIYRQLVETTDCDIYPGLFDPGLFHQYMVDEHYGTPPVVWAFSALPGV